MCSDSHQNGRPRSEILLKTEIKEENSMAQSTFLSIALAFSKNSRTFALANEPKVSGQIPEWPNGADCTSAVFRRRWFESIFAHKKRRASLSFFCIGNNIVVSTNTKISAMVSSRQSKVPRALALGLGCVRRNLQDRR